MGLNRVRVDSVKELSSRKTNKELTEENEALKKQVKELQSATSDNTSSIESNTSAIDDILVMILDDTGTTA